MDKNHKTLLWIVSLIIFIWASWGLAMAVIPWPLKTMSFANRGPFGDSFGALNTLFTGIALAAVLYGVFVQHQEAKIRDQERHEDAIEARFFQMLNIYRDQVRGMTFGTKQGKEGLHQQIALIQKTCLEDGKNPMEAYIAFF